MHEIKKHYTNGLRPSCTPKKKLP